VCFGGSRGFSGKGSFGDEKGHTGFIGAGAVEEYIFGRAECFASEGGFGDKGADEGGVVPPDVFGEGGAVVGEAEYVLCQWFSRCI
jgi:hypothetical protein